MLEVSPCCAVFPLPVSCAADEAFDMRAHVFVCNSQAAFVCVKASPSAAGSSSRPGSRHVCDLMFLWEADLACVLASSRYYKTPRCKTSPSACAIGFAVADIEAHSIGCDARAVTFAVQHDSPRGVACTRRSCRAQY